jgi:hypothetical protein
MLSMLVQKYQGKSNPESDFRNSNHTYKSKWPPEKHGAWQIKDFPNDIQHFKKYLPTLRKIFTLKEKYIQKAQQR